MYICTYIYMSIWAQCPTCHGYREMQSYSMYSSSQLEHSLFFKFSCILLYPCIGQVSQYTYIYIYIILILPEGHGSETPCEFIRRLYRNPSITGRFPIMNISESATRFYSLQLPLSLIAPDKNKHSATKQGLKWNHVTFERQQRL